MSVRVVNRLPQFSTEMKVVLNDTLRSTSADILEVANTRAPYDKGGLRGNKDTKQVVFLHWRISFWIEYASYQEAGQRRDGSRRVRKYTTPGTGPHYLERSGDEAVKRLVPTIKMQLTRIR